MCITTPLQQKIIDRTNEGDQIAAFLVDTMNGHTPGVKVCHRMDATKQLIKHGFSNSDGNNSVRPEPVEGHETTGFSTRHSCEGRNPEGRGEASGDDETVRPEPVEGVRGTENTPSPSTDARRGIRPDAPAERQDRPTENSELITVNSPITHLDILNYEVAHLIRSETAEGHTIVNFLVDTMTGRDRPFTPKKLKIKPSDRIAAARELLRRGFGDLGSRRKLSDTSDEANAYDTLHTDLARRMREYSERGTDTVRFLLEVMSDPNPELEFTIHHRISAAQELLRRGWDTNHDNIKPEHLQAYWRDKESSRLSIGQKKTLSGFTTSIDDYDNYGRHRLRSHRQRDERRGRPRSRRIKVPSPSIRED